MEWPMLTNTSVYYILSICRIGVCHFSFRRQARFARCKNERINIICYNRGMEESIEVDVDTTVLKELRSEKRKKNVKGVTKKKVKQKRNEEAQVAADDIENLPGSGDDQSNNPVGTTVSVFDYSVENHFKAVDTICKLSGDAEWDSFNKNDINHLSLSITFLREWKYFSYPPRRIRFTCPSESAEKKDEIGRINLPPFSAAIVPKKEIQDQTFPEYRSCCSKDFVIYVGGPVWALDWCPKVPQKPDHHIKCEFVAISAHPPESSYHKIGTPLTGRGIVQVWCVLNASSGVDMPHQVKKKGERNPSNSSVLVGSTATKKPRGRPRKKPVNESAYNLDGDDQFVQAEINSTEPKKPRGRPRKKPVNESAYNLDGDDQFVQAEINSTEPKKPRGRPRKKPMNESVDNLDCNDQYVQAEIDSPQLKKLRGGQRKKPMNDSVNNLDCHNQLILAQVGSTQPKKSRGRPRKKPINESVDNLDCSNTFEQTPAVQFPEDSSELLRIDWVPTESYEHVGKKKSGRKHKVFNDMVSVDDSTLEVSMQTRRMKEKVIEESYIQVNRMPSLTENMDKESFQGNLRVCSSRGQDPIGSSESGEKNCPSEICPSGNPIPKDVVLPTDEVPTATHEHVGKRKSARKKCKGFMEIESVDDSALKASAQRRRMKEKVGEEIFIHGMPSLTENENSETFPTNAQGDSSCGKDPIGSCENGAKNSSSETSPSCNPIPKDVALPRVVLCLAHNGKVAWDVKWRPVDVYDETSKHRMGYLAVLLGNGTLEVWEVPFPSAIKSIYSACQKEGIDPRFVKLDPVFRCSKLMCGDRQSIPLTMEWSTSSTHDFILAGCHDGLVALWKFSANCSSKDTRPLLCFSADTVPIRALAWAPAGSDSESANVIVTAGHRGLKFWDIRDPFRPLWDFNAVQRVIYSLDWLPDPRCIVVSFDDGTLRILSLLKAACDVPVTGKPFVGTQQQGFFSYYCSSFTIWNVQVSRLTGMVAYSSADGNVLRFQLTTRAVERDHLRNRAPHFLCGSLIEEESALTVVTPVPDTPFPMKKSLNEWSNAPRTMRGFVSVSNQAKRAKDQMAKGRTSEDQILALCNGDDPGMEVRSDDALLLKMSKQKSKSIKGSNKKLKPDVALICRDEEPGNMHNKDGLKGDVGNSVEVFPPKIIAMHRVRWNVNKGSERWLCYGGAAGIVRFQEIDV